MTKNDLPTNAEVEAMAAKDLVALYNKLRPSSPTKRFATRADGVKRVLELVVAARKVLAKASEHIDTQPKAKKVAAPKAPKAESVGGFIKEMVKAGKTNAEIWAAAQPKFNLSEGKRYYPAWYRRDLSIRGH